MGDPCHQGSRSAKTWAAGLATCPNEGLEEFIGGLVGDRLIVSTDSENVR